MLNKDIENLSDVFRVISIFLGPFILVYLLITANTFFSNQNEKFVSGSYTVLITFSICFLIAILIKLLMHLLTSHQPSEKASK